MSRKTPAERLYLGLVHAVASRRSWPVVRAAARGSAIFLNLYENLSYEPARNGESRVIDALAADRARCVFDVGANVGLWAAHVRTRLPDAQVHAFEIVPATAAELTARYADDPMVVTNAFGLAAAAGTARVRHYPGFAEGSSITGYDHDLPSEWIDCPVQRGADYCDTAGVDVIDLLKVDAEGADLDVLRGFEPMFAEGRVRVVQFEYGRANIISRALLRDFAAFFHSGYELGKIFPRSVEFRPYELTHEDFRGPNFLALRRGETALRARLVAAAT